MTNWPFDDDFQPTPVEFGCQPNLDDYRALALLRDVSRRGGGRIGILWSREPYVPDPNRILVAIHPDRLWPAAMRDFDSKLFDLLSGYSSGVADAKHIASAVLPEATFVGAPLPLMTDKPAVMEGTVAALTEVSLVYVDAFLARRHIRNAAISNELNLQDIATLYGAGKSLVFQAHLSRMSGNDDVEALATTIRQTCVGGEVWTHRRHSSLLVAMANPASGEIAAALVSGCQEADPQFMTYNRIC